MFLSAFRISGAPRHSTMRCWRRSATGGADEGAPGPRPEYGPDYHGAFVRDPDGNKIEACLNQPG